MQPGPSPAPEEILALMRENQGLRADLLASEARALRNYAAYDLELNTLRTFMANVKEAHAATMRPTPQPPP